MAGAKLMFSVGIADPTKRLDEIKKQISDWSNSNPIRLKVELEDLRSQLRSLGVVFGENSKQIKSLSKDVDLTLSEVNKKIGQSIPKRSLTEFLRKETEKDNVKIEKQIADSNKRIKANYDDLMSNLMGLQSSRGQAKALGFNISQDNLLIQNIKSFAAEMDRMRNNRNFLSNIESVDAIIRKLQNYMQILASVRKEYDTLLNKAQSTQKNNAKQSVIDTKSIQEAVYQVSLLETRLNKLYALEQKAGNMGIDTSKLKILINEMEQYLTKFRQVIDNGGRLGNGKTAFNLRSEGDMRSFTSRISDNTREIKENIRHKEQMINLEAQMSGSIGNTTATLGKQSQVLSDLRSMAQQYISVWAAKNFVDNIIEQGGMLEQQRLSIQAILGDAAQAQTLFQKVKNLAVMSPFGVIEIDRMTKQLSAYGFEYKELFDMTKRLADISAATGTDVSRLALALGHVRSEAALSGYTLRQFSMGNVPLLQKLSEKLGVTTKKVREMVSKKEIGYDQVVEVIKELTDESGMFYNAQETMSQALNAKFKNLRDSYQIMYSEMAEGTPGDALKGLADILTELSRNWRILLPMISTGVGLFGISKATTAAFNSELIRTASATNTTALATSKYNVAQLRTIATTRALHGGLWRLPIILGSIRTGLLSIGKFLLNPAMMGFAAIEGLVYLWQRHNQEMERAKELTSSYALESAEAIRNLNARMDGIDPFNKDMTESQLKQGIDAMTETLKNYAVNANEVMNTAFASGQDGKVKSLAEQYNYLREKMQETIDTYREMGRTADAFEFGIKYTDGGWFDDSVETDLTQYANAVKNYEDSITEFTANNQIAIKKSLDAVKEIEPVFAAVSNELKSDAERVKWLMDNQGRWSDLFQNFKNQLRLNGSDYGGVLGYNTIHNIETQRKEAMGELDQFFVGIEERLKKFGYDFSNNGKELTKEQVGNLLKQTREWIDKHPEWNSIIDIISEKFDKRWGIKVYFETDEAEKQLNEWQQQMQDWLDKHKSTIKIKPEMSRDDIIKLVHNSIKDTQEVIDQTKPILLRFGVDLSNIPNELPLGLKTPWGKKQVADYKSAVPQNKVARDFLAEFGLPAVKVKRSGSKSTEDRDAKRLREIARLYKDAYDWYNKYEKQVGKGSALEKVQKQFQPLFDEFSKQFGQTLSLDSIPEYRENLTALLDEAMKIYSDPKHKNSYMVQAIQNIRDAINNVDYEEAQRKMDEYASSVQIELDSLTRAWDTYNDIRKSTGDIDLALRMAGISINQEIVDNFAEALKKRIQDSFSDLGGGILDFNSDLSDKDLENEIKSKMPKESEEKIKGYVEAYKKWRDLQRDVLRNDISIFTQLSVDAESLRENVSKLNSEYQETIKSLNRLLELGRQGKNGGISQEQYDRSKQTALNNRNVGYMSAMVNGIDWSQTFTGVGNVLQSSVKLLYREISNTIKSADFRKMNSTQQKQYLDLAKKLRDNGGAGGVSPFNLKEWGKIGDLSKKYRESVNILIAAMKKQIAAQNEYDAAYEKFSKASTQEEKDAAKTILKRAKMALEQANTDVQNAQTNTNQTGNQLSDASQRAAKGLNDFSMIVSQFTSGSLSGIVLAIGNIIRSISGAQGGLAENIGQLFGELGEEIGGLIGAILQLIDLLGEEPAKFIDELLRKVAAVVEAVLSELPQIIGNIIMGVFNIVTSAIDGIGGLFGLDFGLTDAFDWDRSNKRLIEAMEVQIKAIESNTEAIKNYRERSLGYDTGDMRRNMANYYGYPMKYYDYDLLNDQKGRILEQVYLAIPGIMNDYMSRNSQGTGYKQELENLKSERDRVVVELAAERDKKNSSDEAIEEYKKKIAELDEQIVNFAQDLAEELWGIDLKGWADQIGDALWTAFENGEDAVKAFGDTAKQIIADVAKKMMNLHFIEPAMKALEEELFGRVDSNGNYISGAAYNEETGEWNEEETLRILGRFFGEDGEFAKVVDSAEQFYKMAERVTGVDFSSDGNTSMSGGIKGVTEQTADLIASYLNAIRADVSVNRAMIAQYFPLFLEAVTANSKGLTNIEQNVDAIMKSNQIIADKISSIEHNFSGLKNNTWRLPI